MIDWSRISELREEIGAEDFEEIVELFLNEVEERLETLGAEKPLAEVGEDLHFLKGSALNLGFDQLAKLCHEGELRVGAGEEFGDFEVVKSTYQKSKTAFLQPQ